MKSFNRFENEQVWRARVTAAGKREGTILEFCHEYGISREALRYWQRKLSRSKQSLEVRSPFARVEIVDAAVNGAPAARARHLPDAAWVADLILHLSQGCGQ